jgi:hypothetical protein
LLSYENFYWGQGMKMSNLSLAGLLSELGIVTGVGSKKSKMRPILLGVLLFTSMSSSAALIGRLPSTLGGTDYQAYYDTDQDITWLTDANYAQTSGYDSDGHMTWDATQVWLGTLNAANFLGEDSWRLPYTPNLDPTCTSSYQYTSGSVDYGKDCTGNEMGYLSTTYGNPYSCQFTSDCTASLSNTQRYWYWSSDNPFSSFSARSLRFYDMFFSLDSYTDFNHSKQNEFAVIVVLDGDISAVPVPAAVWLFGSALAGLGWIRRKPTA